MGKAALPSLQTHCIKKWITRFLLVDTRSAETIVVRAQNMQICYSLKCKLIDLSTTDQLTATFRSNATIPQWIFRSNPAMLKFNLTLSMAMYKSKFHSLQNQFIIFPRHIHNNLCFYLLNSPCAL